MGKSRIEWTDEVWNPLRGCSRISTECTNCYAERYAARFNKPGQPFEGLAKFTKNGPRWTGKVKLVVEVLDRPLKWTRPRNVFVNSMSDLFHENVPNTYIMEIFMVMAQARRHRFVVLTKRAERMYEWFQTDASREVQVYAQSTVGVEWPLENVILGVSVGTQDSVDNLVPHLLGTPAATRMVSAEPLLEEIDLTSVACPHSAMSGAGNNGACMVCGDWSEEACSNGFVNGLAEGIHWVVVGGESGPVRRIRPMQDGWVRKLRDQCRTHQVAFFYKQRIDHGKKVSLPMLDGKQHAEYPV